MICVNFLTVTFCHEDPVLLHGDRWSCSSSTLRRVWLIIVVVIIIIVVIAIIMCVMALYVCHQLFQTVDCYIVYNNCPVGEQSIVISLSVCLCVCLSVNISLELQDRSSQFFCADPLWLLLSVPLAALQYVMYLQFYGWCLDWPYWAVWWCVEGWTFNLLPLAALRYRGGVWCLWMLCWFLWSFPVTIVSFMLVCWRLCKMSLNQMHAHLQWTLNSPHLSLCCQSQVWLTSWLSKVPLLQKQS